MRASYTEIDLSRTNCVEFFEYSPSIRGFDKVTDDVDAVVIEQPVRTKTTADRIIMVLFMANAKNSLRYT